MQKSQSGFTLVELVVVIVLLGILGVTALGKFQNLSADAQTAANAGIASELSSASAINFAAWNLNQTNTNVTTITTEACDESAIGGLFTGDIRPPNYKFDPNTTNSSCATTGTFICDVYSDKAPPGISAPATLICTQ